jgi:hypothetical protein
MLRNALGILCYKDKDCIVQSCCFGECYNSTKKMQEEEEEEEL